MATKRTLLEQELEDRLERMRADSDKWFSKFTASQLLLKGARYEAGMLQSEVEELKYNNKLLIQENHAHKLHLGEAKEIKREAKIEFQKDKMVENIKNQNTKLLERCALQSKSISDLVTQVVTLRSKLNNEVVAD